MFFLSLDRCEENVCVCVRTSDVSLVYKYSGWTKDISLLKGIFRNVFRDDTQVESLDPMFHERNDIRV